MTDLTKQEQALALAIAMTISRDFFFNELSENQRHYIMTQSIDILHKLNANGFEIVKKGGEDE